MNACRILRKGSGVIFGESVFHMVRCCPKTTPDPVALEFTLQRVGVRRLPQGTMNRELQRNRSSSGSFDSKKDLLYCRTLVLS